jgi:hypothetical protein
MLAENLRLRILEPGGSDLTLPLFLYRPYSRSLKNGRESADPTGPLEWRARFTPRRAGALRVALEARDGEQWVEQATALVTALPSDAHGFISVSPTNPRLLAFDDGAPFFAIGENLCWPGPRGTYDYDYYLAKISAHRANLIRIWVGPTHLFTLERIPNPGEQDVGLGRYDLRAAWYLDTFMEAARRHGVAVLLCTESFPSLRSSEPHAIWDLNPYNSANAGPCAQPSDFFINPRARSGYSRLLDYMSARWGPSPSLFAWELWNEVDITQNYDSHVVREWHRVMAAHLRSVDPYHHLITTSFAFSEGDPTIDALDELDLVQTHCYSAEDFAMGLYRYAQQKRFLRKPHLVAEFGLQEEAQRKADPKGLHLHNGIWSTALSGNAGAAMLWDWDSYVDAFDLYPQFRALADFLDGVPWRDPALRPVEALCDGVPQPDANTPLRVFGIQTDRQACLWLQNPQSTVGALLQEQTPAAVSRPVRVGVLPGKYLVRWFDTWAGRWTKQETLEAGPRWLDLSPPPVERDLACALTPAP